MTVQPHEPVSFGFNARDTYNWRRDHGYRACYPEFLVRLSSVQMNVTLANGQRIIVRALSEERKAARAFQKRVSKAVEANR